MGLGGVLLLIICSYYIDLYVFFLDMTAFF
jgi:hypothetical protein